MPSLGYTGELRNVKSGRDVLYPPAKQSFIDAMDDCIGSRDAAYSLKKSSKGFFYLD